MGRRAAQTRKLSDRINRFINRSGRMCLKIGHYRFLMRDQLALRLTKTQFLQPGDAALNILLQVAAKSLSAHACQPRDLLMRKTLAFQPKRFHLASHVWMRMVKALACQNSRLRWRKCQFQHGRTPKEQAVRQFYMLLDRIIKVVYGRSWYKSAFP